MRARLPILCWLSLGLSAISACTALPGSANDDRGGERLSHNGTASAAGVPRSPSTTGHLAASHLVIAALNFLDRPYRLGGDSAETGFDCSGFTRHLFDSALGIRLPRRADEQAHASEFSPVPRNALQAGDLVFFNTLKRTFSHVGIYVGDGRFIHAPRTGAQVRIEDMSANYWSRRYTGARRATALAAPTLDLASP
jgi:cell wall-associated NlpC family hydrolase